MKAKTLILTVCLLLLVRVDVMAGDFTDNGDGTVTDDNTGLMWQQGEGGQKTWEDAISYCENLSIAVYTDWRLPDKNELNSIIDYESYHPAIDTTYFPGASASTYWSSTTDANHSSFAWLVYLYGGNAYYRPKSYNRDVRCVRAGQ